MNLKIMKTKYLMIATVAMLLTACSNDENEVNDGPVAAQVSASFGAESRAVNTDNTWAANDAIGVMVTKVEQPTGGNAATSDMVTRYKNVKYTTKNGGSPATFEAEAGQGIFFQDATETVTFAAYYPYQTSTDASTLPDAITVNTKDNNTDANQATIDFLFASGATASKSTPTVEFNDNSSSGGTNCQFKHQMAQLKLVIVGSTANGFTDTEAKAVCDNASVYKLGGLKHKGSFTLEVSTDETAIGTAVATGSAVDDWTITGCVKEDKEDEYKRTYTLVLLPQDCSGTALKFEATIGGQIYKNDTNIKPNLEAGKSYTYTITVKKTGLVVSGCTIAPWTVESEQKGDATM